MTVFAVMTAGLFPIIHIGRQWFFYWLLPYPEPALPLAQLQVAADLGRLRHLDLPDRVHHLPRRGPGARHRGGARQGHRLAEEALRRLLACGWTGSRQPVAPLHPGLSLPGRPGHAAGALGALGRVLGLRDVDHPGLARDDLRALLRGRRHLLRHRHGAHAADPAPQGCSARAHDHRLPLRQPGQADAVHRVDPVLRLRDGVLRRLVQREHLRAGHLLAPGVRADVVGGLER